jgi:hypothetical protein
MVNYLNFLKGEIPMRTRFTFISLLLLIIVSVGYFLSYMCGFLNFSPGEIQHSIEFWRPQTRVTMQEINRR